MKYWYYENDDYAGPTVNKYMHHNKQLLAMLIISNLI